MMVQILDTAEEDLVEGYWFYEMQQRAGRLIPQQHLC
jgi:hypothetical protein